MSSEYWTLNPRWKPSIKYRYAFFKDLREKKGRLDIDLKHFNHELAFLRRGLITATLTPYILFMFYTSGISLSAFDEHSTEVRCRYFYKVATSWYHILVWSCFTAVLVSNRTQNKRENPEFNRYCTSLHQNKSTKLIKMWCFFLFFIYLFKEYILQ